MVKKIVILAMLTGLTGSAFPMQLPGPYTEVDQVVWVVSRLDHTIKQYAQLGFSQVLGPVKAGVINSSGEREAEVLLARTNLAGALVTWIQPLEGSSVFHDFHGAHGDGAMSLVHRFPGLKEQDREARRLKALGIGVLDRVILETETGDLQFLFMDTEEKGKYVLGFTCRYDPMMLRKRFDGANRHNMVINQYAFAIREPGPVSDFWQRVGLPEFRINHPELGDTHYYGKIVDHQLIQGWQRHGAVSYEWCIPVKPPIVYEDHIRRHGEGIHHLAFTVPDMDRVLEDYTSRGFVVSMGGTWGEKGKPGSGRYEYIDLDDSGGLTMELLWSFQSSN